ncbi:unnamed protein product [Amoebophrya sp. A120]|nr:unnamed protein product [Amoebophrya sp. A120]|eukprot:GSA120T00017759001.1
MAHTTTTLVDLLEKCGPGHEILSFLHGGEVAGLACVSKTARAAVSRDDGTLRCDHLVIRFGCKARMDDFGSFMIAQRRDLGHIFTRVDLRGVQSLLVEVRADYGEHPEEPPVVIDHIIPDILPLMCGQKLRQFGMIVLDITPIPRRASVPENWRRQEDPEPCEQSAFTRFARALSSLRGSLEVLHLPGCLAEQSIDLPPDVIVRMRKLRELHITSVFDFGRVSSDSLLSAVLPEPAGATGPRGLAVFSCRGFRVGNWTAFQTGMSGKHTEIWRKIATPSLRKLSFRIIWSTAQNYYDDVIKKATWFWRCCENVTSLEVDIVPCDEVLALLPNLRSLTLAGRDWLGGDDYRENNARGSFVNLVRNFNFRKCALVLHRVELSHLEFGILFGILTGVYKEIVEHEENSAAASPFLHNRKLWKVLSDILDQQTEQDPPREAKMIAVTSGPPLCPMVEMEVNSEEQEK